MLILKTIQLFLSLFFCSFLFSQDLSLSPVQTIQDLELDKQTTNELLSLLSNYNEKQKTELTDLQKKSQELTSKLELFKQDISTLQSQLVTLTTLSEEQQNTILQLRESLKSLKKEVEDLKAEYELQLKEERRMKKTSYAVNVVLIILLIVAL